MLSLFSVLIYLSFNSNHGAFAKTTPDTLYLFNEYEVSQLNRRNKAEGRHLRRLIAVPVHGALSETLPDNLDLYVESEVPEYNRNSRTEGRRLRRLAFDIPPPHKGGKPPPHEAPKSPVKTNSSLSEGKTTTKVVDNEARAASNRNEANVAVRNEANVAGRNEANVAGRNEANVAGRNEANVAGRNEANVAVRNEAVRNEAVRNEAVRNEANVAGSNEANVAVRNEANVAGRNEANEANVAGRNEANAAGRNEANAAGRNEASAVNEGEANANAVARREPNANIARFLESEENILNLYGLGRRAAYRRNYYGDNREIYEIALRERLDAAFDFRGGEEGGMLAIEGGEGVGKLAIEGGVADLDPLEVNDVGSREANDVDRGHAKEQESVSDLDPLEVNDVGSREANGVDRGRAKEQESVSDLDPLDDIPLSRENYLSDEIIVGTYWNGEIFALERPVLRQERDPYKQRLIDDIRLKKKELKAKYDRYDELRAVIKSVQREPRPNHISDKIWPSIKEGRVEKGFAKAREYVATLRDMEADLSKMKELYNRDRSESGSFDVRWG